MSPAPSSQVLPNTGTEAQAIAIVALAFLFAGAGIVYLARRVDDQAKEIDKQ